MELVSFGKEVLQNIAEQAASYRLGQSALRYIDRALWVVEKCARWAVPPPLDQDERPQPELVRPLPWVFFLAMLITLRVTRESISLVNLVMGKPPLRSADVVMYIQSKRRYLRTLKYQGSRMMRARSTPAQPNNSWYSRLHSLMEMTMCFRRHSHNYGNNNTTRVSNNEEVLVVKRSRRGRAGAAAGSAGSAGDSTMERLIEKMIIDLDADSDDDSSFTLTNVTSVRSDRSDMGDSDQDTILHNDDSSTTSKSEQRTNDEISFTPNKSAVSTPERTESPKITENNTSNNTSTNTEEAVEMTEDVAIATKANNSPKEEIPTNYSPKEETKLFLQSETTQPKPEPQKKTANGAIARPAGKKKGLNSDRRDSDMCVPKTKSTDKTM